VHKALVGPWGHTWPERAIPGPIIGFLQENLRWWDRWLKGIDTGVENDPTVRYWLQDTATMKPDLDLRPGRWIQADAFPTIESHGARHFALDAGGVLGAVAAEPGSAPGHESADIVAPLTVSHRSELTVGQQAGHWLPMGSPLDLPREQSIDDEGSLVFDTAPLRNPLHLVGQPVLKLRVAADKPLAFVFVRLSEVTPDGTVNLITRANLNLTHRDSHEFPEPLVPGQFYPVSIALKNVAQTLPAGHRLRIALSTNYWPWIWPTAEQAEITVALGESYLEFPLVDEDRLEPMTASFERAEISEPIEVVDTGIHRPYWKRTHDDATGVSVMARSSDGTGVKRTPNGLTFSGKDETRYIITDGDPLSAVMECDRFFLFEREDWSVRVEMSSRMSSTATDFVVETRLRAFTAGVCVHEEDRTTAIPRDLN
jgi:predicted acyl esterase